MFDLEEQNQFIESLRRKPPSSAIIKDEYSSLMLKEHITISDLLVPFFISYCLYDPVIKKYQQERECIINTISQTHFSSEVLNLLDYDIE